MRRPLTLLLTVVLVFSSMLLVSRDSSAPAPAPEDFPGPHLAQPNPEVYDRLPFPQSPPILPPLGRTRGPSSNRVLVLLIDFTDKVHQSAHDPLFMGDLMNGNSPGKLRNYYSTASYGDYTVQATVGGSQWFMSTRTMAYYGADSATGVDDLNGPIYELVREAVQRADAAGVDFPSFDFDGDGMVDHLIVVHAGDGQESTKRNNEIWSHRWAVVNPNLYVGGVQVYNYVVVSENSPIGVIAHEFGHDLGLPDLYDTDQSSKGAGIWDLMATGSWAGPTLSPGTSPAHLSAWSKIKLGWIRTPIVVTAPRYSVNILEVETNPVAFKLPIRESPSEEYFLVENRQKVGYDNYMPGSGLLIWHIDESVPDNDNDVHRMVDLVEADGGDNPEDAGDVWASNAPGFTPDSIPNSNGYGNVRTGWKVRNIGPTNVTMTADISREVDDDMAVVSVVNARSVALNTPVTIRVEAANLGARNQTNVPVTLTIYRGGHTAGHKTYNASRTLSLTAKTYTNFTWTFTPQNEGRHLIEVGTILARDEIPENNYKLTHFNAIDPYFYDDVESTKVWTATPAGELHQWLIVQQGDTYGDAYSPTHSWRFGYFGGLPASVTSYTLESPSISFPGGPLYLSFFHRYQLAVPSEVNVSTTDEAYVKVSFNGGPWLELPGGRFNQTQTLWTLFYANLTGNASSPGTMRLRFESTAAYMPPSGGWWIDDVFVSPYRLRPGVGLLPVNTAITVEPGGKASFIFKLVNVGDFNDSFRFVVESETSWTVALNHDTSTGLVPETVAISLNSDSEAILTLVVQTPGDVPRGTEARFTLTAKSTTCNCARESFSVLVTISDPLGLAKWSRYIVLFVFVLIVLVAIALIVDHIKRRRGIR